MVTQSRLTGEAPCATRARPSRGVCPLSGSVQWRGAQSAGRKEALLPSMTDTQTTNQNKGRGPSRFAAMFEATQAATPNGQMGGEGEIVSGLVVQVNRDSVVVDIGGQERRRDLEERVRRRRRSLQRQGRRTESMSSSRAVRVTMA